MFRCHSRSPVKAGLCERPEDWEWSSFLHYATGGEGRVEIESEWTARKRERAAGKFVSSCGTAPLKPKEGLSGPHGPVRILRIWRSSTLSRGRVGILTSDWQTRWGAARVPLDKSEGVVKGIVTLGGAQAPSGLPERLRTRLWKSHAKSPAAELRSTNHRFDPFVGHDSSMRTSRLYGMRERPINITV